jgi:hypothetical protein
MNCSVLTNQSASLAHDYTPQSYSTVQSYADNMNHQYTMWKHMLQTDSQATDGNIRVMGSIRFASYRHI